MADDARTATAAPVLPAPVSADELLASAHVVALPMGARFRGITTRETVLLRGPAGWAEWGPFPEYDDAEATRWLAAAVESGWGTWPEPVRQEVPVNATVPAVPAELVPQILARFDGCRAVKVKVAERGQGLADDIDRVGEVRACLGPDAEVKVDANGAWDPGEALVALTALNEFDLAYAEQPCATVEELAQLRRSLQDKGVAVPVAADESIRRAEDPQRVRELEAADLVVVKAAPLGGVARARGIVEECGLPAVVSSALDTSVGIAAGVALAASLPELPFACGLGTVALFAHEVTSVPLAPRDGVLRVEDALRVRAEGPDPQALENLAASPERERWWRERLARCAALIEP